jgi:rhamnosyltransferase
VVVVDSGSRDGTLEHARQRGAAVVTIAPDAFDHGSTRNLAIERSSGALVALLVQDAVPASRGWLRALTAPFRKDPTLAGTFGRQIPWPDAGALTRWSMRDWIASGPSPRVSGPFSAREFERLTPQQRHGACVFDNVCSCVRRDVWARHPFRPARIAEDLEWGREVLLAGFRIAYVPEAAVWHSHERGVGYEWRRTRDVHRRLFDLFELATIPSAEALLRSISFTVPAHVRVALRDRSVAALARAAALGIVWPLGQYVGARSARGTPSRHQAGGARSVSSL